MIKRLLFLSLTCFSSLHTYAQVGVNTKTPNSTLQVKGSLALPYLNSSTVSNSDENYYVGNNNHYFVFEGIKNGSLEIKDEGKIGRMYRIKNASNFYLLIKPETQTNTFRLNNTTNQVIITLEPGDYIEIIKAKESGTNTWETNYIAKPIPNYGDNLLVYGAKLIIPPMRSTATTWTSWNTDTSTFSGITPAQVNSLSNDQWNIISKTQTLNNNPNPASSNGSNLVGSFKITRANNNNAYFVSSIEPSKMTLVYEYQGAPFTNLNRIYPLLTAGNNSSFPDVFSATIEQLYNHTNNKTRLKVIVTRLDLIGERRTPSQESDWMGTFSLNILLTNQ